MSKLNKLAFTALSLVLVSEAMAGRYSQEDLRLRRGMNAPQFKNVVTVLKDLNGHLEGGDLTKTVQKLKTDRDTGAADAGIRALVTGAPSGNQVINTINDLNTVKDRISTAPPATVNDGINTVITRIDSTILGNVETKLVALRDRITSVPVADLETAINTVSHDLNNNDAGNIQTKLTNLRHQITNVAGTDAMTEIGTVDAVLGGAQSLFQRSNVIKNGLTNIGGDTVTGAVTDVNAGLGGANSTKQRITHVRGLVTNVAGADLTAEVTTVNNNLGGANSTEERITAINGIVSGGAGATLAKVTNERNVIDQTTANITIHDALDALHDDILGVNNFNTLQGTANGIEPLLVNGIPVIGGGNPDEINGLTRNMLKIAYRWSQGTGAVAHNGGANLALGGATENDVTVEQFLNALVARTLH